MEVSVVVTILSVLNIVSGNVLPSASVSCSTAGGGSELTHDTVTETLTESMSSKQGASAVDVQQALLHNLHVRPLFENFPSAQAVHVMSAVLLQAVYSSPGSHGVEAKNVPLTQENELHSWHTF
jgi:hypothetical protein